VPLWIRRFIHFHRKPHRPNLPKAGHAVPSPTAANQHWTMDFDHDQLLDGRAFRM
jgi:hypothetical protein